MSPETWGAVGIIGIFTIGLTIAKFILRNKDQHRSEAWWREQEKDYLLRRWQKEIQQEDAKCKRK